jgi:uncharacterized membrane protein
MSRAGWVTVFLLLHVLGAIAAVGPTLTYGLWASRAAKAGSQVRTFVIESTAWVDSHLATPAFVLQAVTGMALVLLQERDFFDTAWLLMGVGLYVAVFVLAVVGLAPATRRHRAASVALDANPEDPEARSAFGRASASTRTLGIVLGVLTLGIVYFMVVKPELWSAG